MKPTLKRCTKEIKKKIGLVLDFDNKGRHKIFIFLGFKLKNKDEYIIRRYGRFARTSREIKRCIEKAGWFWYNAKIKNWGYTAFCHLESDNIEEAFILDKELKPPKKFSHLKNKDE
ncbi:unnamed protein product [marine sediment metagenome]|uniref:Uncharacterized protein n=1 Tax=marine sediment metagenome TaxID=412755 RepID=X0TDZ6_9ZZZZ